MKKSVLCSRVPIPEAVGVLLAPVLRSCRLSCAMRCLLFQAATGLLCGASVLAGDAPDRITIRVDAAAKLGPFDPVWSYFGYDEPNYTYTSDGRKLLAKLATLNPGGVYIRTHNLLTSGDGTPALKWGSTNAYTEDAAGNDVYDWTILDRIFDAYRDAGVKPLVEIGFMPEALSTHPQPYRHDWPKGKLWTGWAYPPKDYGKWAELVHRWVRHLVDRYGRGEVESWLWEVWNEPDIGYWRGSREEYFKLYDYSADAVKRALPKARVGGPHATGPGSDRAADFLRRFLEHCSRGTNSATGKTGSPLDFIAFHAKGSPRWVDGHARMGINAHLRSIDRGFEVVASFPEWRETPIILGESDPEGCAACSAQMHPENIYRESPLYGAYTALVLKNLLELAQVRRVHVQGVVTWAFEFVDQPYFAGLRELSTHGIDKPVLNVFRMLGRMHGDRVRIDSSGSILAQELLRAGVRTGPDVDGLATTRGDEIFILVWNYHDDDLSAPAAAIDLVVEHLPASARHVTLRHFRVDSNHSNAYTLWKQMNSPQHPTPEQSERLQAAGQLQRLAPDETRDCKGGAVGLHFPLPRKGVSLVELKWN